MQRCAGEERRPFLYLTTGWRAWDTLARARLDRHVTIARAETLVDRVLALVHHVLQRGVHTRQTDSEQAESKKTRLL
jgi:hypothetical protein